MLGQAVRRSSSLGRLEAEDGKTPREGRGMVFGDRSGVWEKVLLAAMALVLLALCFSQRSWTQGPKSHARRMVLQPPPVDPDSFSGMLRERAIDNQIVLTVTTISFLNMTLNMLCSWEKIGLTNYVVGALDQPVLEVLKERGYPVFPAYKHSLLGGEELVSAVKRREDFHKANLVKEEAIIWAMQDGYEVALTDTDLVWVHNPMKDLRENYREFDFVFQTANNEDHVAFDLNGGFLYVKPTKESLAVMNLLISTLTQDFGKNDQTEFRNILCEGSKRTSNTTCDDSLSGAKTLMLSRYKYAKRFILSTVDDAQTILEDPNLFTLHYNGGVPDKKKMYMENDGQWYLDDDLNCAV